MVKKIRRKVKKIAMKASLISMELEDLSEENEEHKKTLAEDFKNEFAFIEWKRQQEKLKQEKELQEKTQSCEEAPETEAKPEEPESDCSEEDLEDLIEESSETSNIPTELKKLYRSIAQKTHPDKTKDERLNEIFKLSADAMAEGNWMALVEFAGELGLNIEFLSEETCEAVEKSIESNEMKIKVIKSTFSYMWGHQKTEQDRQIFKAMFYQQFKINTKEYEEWLNSQESSSS